MTTHQLLTPLLADSGGSFAHTHQRAPGQAHGFEVPALLSPQCRTDLDARGWDAVDFVVISGDACVDHPAGSLFAPEQVARLPPGPQRMVATSASLTRAPWERVALAYWWRGGDEGFTAVIAAADRSKPSRTRDILSGQHHFASPWLCLLTVNPLDVRFEMYAESHEVLALSAGLVCAAVTARGNVPTPTSLLDVQVRAGLVEVPPRQSEWRRASFTAPLRTPALPE